MNRQKKCRQKKNHILEIATKQKIKNKNKNESRKKRSHEDKADRDEKEKTFYIQQIE